MNVTQQYGLTRVINVSGTMTALGASTVSAEVVDAVADILPRFVNMVELQQRASDVISRVIGSDAGCVTASIAAAIPVGIAACMTRSSMARVEQLPDTHGLHNEVILQRGHSAWFGSSIRQMAALSGAKVVEIGDIHWAGRYQLEEAINENTAAALYVVSHHTSQFGLISLPDFCCVAHAHGIPVVVDAASESDMASFIEAGADLVGYSGHKFLAGPTSGIIAGRRDLINACLLHQYHGIGRAMKVGKESIIGAMVALERWADLDHSAVQAKENTYVQQFVAGLSGISGLSVEIKPDPTGNPINRVRVSVDSDVFGLTAYQLISELAAGNPAIIVRGHEAIDFERFYLDPCNITANDEVQTVIDAIRALGDLSQADKQTIKERYPSNPNAADELSILMSDWMGS